MTPSPACSIGFPSSTVLEKEMSPSSRDAPLSVLMLDWERFKQINHTQAIWRATLCGIRR
jgi:hypothetical protein